MQVDRVAGHTHRVPEHTPIHDVLSGQRVEAPDVPGLANVEIVRRADQFGVLEPRGGDPEVLDQRGQLQGGPAHAVGDGSGIGAVDAVDQQPVDQDRMIVLPADVEIIDPNARLDRPVEA